MTYHDEVATRVELCDASHREFDLTHFAGKGILILAMPQCSHREARIDRRMAGELAHLFDHFARHGQLPVTYPRPDYAI